MEVMRSAVLGSMHGVLFFTAEPPRIEVLLPRGRWFSENFLNKPVVATGSTVLGNKLVEVLIVAGLFGEMHQSSHANNIV